MKRLACLVLAALLLTAMSAPVFAANDYSQYADDIEAGFQAVYSQHSELSSWYHTVVVSATSGRLIYLFSEVPEYMGSKTVECFRYYLDSKEMRYIGTNSIKKFQDSGSYFTICNFNIVCFVLDYCNMIYPSAIPDQFIGYTSPPANNTALQVLINQAESLSSDDYTPESWATLQAALAPAKALLTGNSSQQEVDAAADALSSALDGLTEKPPPVSVGELEALIAEAEALNSENYTAGSWSFMDSKLSAARVLLNSTPTQEQVNQAAAELRAAIDALVATVPPQPSVNIEALQALVTQAEALQSKDYTLNSWSALSSALSSARSVLYGNPTQARVDEAAQRLQTALNGLQKRPSGGGAPGEIEVPQDIMDAIGSGNVEGILDIFPSVYLTHATSALPVVIAVFALVVALRAIPKLFKRFVR